MSCHRCRVLVKADQLVDITAEDVQAFGTEILKRLHIETLIHGNSTAEVSRFPASDAFTC